MLKLNSIIIFSLLIVNLLKAQTKNYKITYRQCVQNDTLKMITDTIGIEAVLVGNDKFSNYSFSKLKKNLEKREKLLTFDESLTKAMEAKKDVQFTVSNSVLMDTLGSMVFHNKACDSIFVREQMFEEYVITSEKAPIIDWTIIGDTKMIKSYKCYKATSHFRGRDYTAWFTTDIPIIDAPWKFNGLPGLVMDIYDSKNQVRINVESIEYPTIDKVENFYSVGTKVSLDEYFTYWNNTMLKKSKALMLMMQSQEGIDKTGLKPKVTISNASFGIEISRN